MQGSVVLEVRRFFNSQVGRGMISPAHANRKRQREANPTDFARVAVYEAAKQRDAEAGWQAYQDALQDGVELPQAVLSTLLFMLTGFDQWQDYLKVPIPDDPEEPPEDPPPLHLDWAAEMISKMSDDNGTVDESRYTIKARYCALLGDGNEALRIADECAEKIPCLVRVRTYAPALMAFVKDGDADKALVAHSRMVHKVADTSELTDSEFALLLQVCCSHGSYSQVVDVLEMIGVEMAELTPSMLQILQNYFASNRAATALNEGSDAAEMKRWETSWVDVDPQGAGDVSWAGDKLQNRALTESDWKEFQTALRDVIRRKEARSGDFDEYVEWLEEYPVHIFLDGANIALYGQTAEFKLDPVAAFSWKQIELAVDAVEKQYPDKNIVVVLNIGRVEGPTAFAPEAEALIERLEENDQLYVSPKGSNDDWYWLYGAVSAGKEGFLVSNDEMRDHIFAMLRPRFFLKWKAHHQCKYVVEDDSDTAELIVPPSYTTCVQRLPLGSWMMPQSSSRWLCAKPVSAQDAIGEADPSKENRQIDSMHQAA